MPYRSVFVLRNGNNIYLWTGTGWGKTTSAIGVALRAVGHGKKVVIVQFMKGRKDRIGEYRARKLLGKKYEIHQFGRQGWVKLQKPSPVDKELAEEGLEFARKAAKQKPFLLILDEINLAIAVGLLGLKEVLEFLDYVPQKTTVYLTGRFAPKKLIDRADYATDIRPIKHPLPLERVKKGIDY